TNEDAEEIVPSPDGKWIAFKEQHQIYVAPLPSAIGRPLVIGRNGAPVPVKKVSEIGGSWPIWSADGKSVGWLLGPELAVQEVAPLFVPEAQRTSAAPEKKPETKPAPA